MMEPSQTEQPPITELTKAQRRVLGVLVEKAFTTSDAYPLTLKALTSGCNQKSNRYPVVNYDEDDVAEVLDELRRLGLVAVIHTESGRTERYRHYLRRRFTFTEPQLAVMTELLLRGRQTLGELRTRASRMVSIDSLGQLRDELRGLQEMNYVQASGSLERRGVEVDHNLYPPSEAERIPAIAVAEAPSFPATASVETSATDSNPILAAPPLRELIQRVSLLEQALEQLRTDSRELREGQELFDREFRQLADRFDELRRDLGG